MAQVALTFALYQGGQLVRREVLSQPIVKVGKDPRSHLKVDDEKAARMHAVIEVNSPSDITLIDLGNEPGTLVNGQRVNKCKVRQGDQIQVGDTLIHLEAVGEASQAALVPPPAASSAAAHISAPPPAGSVPPPAFGPSGTQALPAQAIPAPTFASAPPVNPFAAPVSQAPANPFGGAASPFAAAAVPQYDAGYASADYGGHTDHSHKHKKSDPNAQYQLVRSGPDVNPDEVEIQHVSSVEVMVLWDSNILFVKHLTPPRSFYVGEGKTDYQLPAELAGDRTPVVVARGGSIAAVFPRGSRGSVEIPGQGKFLIDDLIQAGRARASSEASGGHEFDLPAGAKARIEIEGGLIFQVSAVNAGKPVAAGLLAGLGAAGLMYVALSALAHSGLFAAFAFFMPSMGSDDADGLDRDAMLRMRKYLDAAAEREREEEKTEQQPDANADNKEGGTGTRAKGEEGSMGNPNTQATGHKYGVQGPQDNPDPHLARQAALQEAAQFGMIGLLNVGAGGDPNAPTAPWGREDSSGNDAMSARGNMWGDTIGDSFGAGGLGLAGVGEGGGGRGEGIGLGNIGTLGHGAGTGTGNGFGSGHGRLGGAHQTKAPSIRQGATTVNGRLPPEVIQRIVRQNFGRFRLCYENGLRTNPNLAGRVSVKFVIDRSGAVSTAQDGGSELADNSVVSCVVRGFNNLSFPQPEGGIVTVVYPIIFNPGD